MELDALNWEVDIRSEHLPCPLMPAGRAGGRAERLAEERANLRSSASLARALARLRGVHASARKHIVFGLGNAWLRLNRA